MMARSTTRSNQRPDTLMQDRICQVDETSCNARPDHTFGSKTEVSALPRDVCSALLHNADINSSDCDVRLVPNPEVVDCLLDRGEPAPLKSIDGASLAALPFLNHKP